MKDHYTYRVTWSAEDGEHVGLCAEFLSLSWLAATPEAALKGIRKVVAQTVDDLQGSGEEVPQPFSERPYSGRFMVRVPPEVHRVLAARAAEAGVSLNRLVSVKLATEQGSSPEHMTRASGTPATKPSRRYPIRELATRTTASSGKAPRQRSGRGSRER